jgi:hypothetical protein
MPAMQCNEFMESLELWLEGDHRPDAEAHLRSCVACSGLVADLGKIRHAARELTDCDPPAQVWTAIRSQLETEGLIASRGWLSWLPSFGTVWMRPAFAGALLAILAAGGFVLGNRVHNYNNRAHWISGNQAATAPIEAELGTFELHAVSALHEPNPTVNVAFKKNLEIVDDYIAECEKSVQDDPEDELSRDYLYGAYQQKADLLEQMSERGGNHQ